MCYGRCECCDVISQTVVCILYASIKICHPIICLFSKVQAVCMAHEPWPETREYETLRLKTKWTCKVKVKGTVKLFLCKPWRHVVRGEVWLHSFLPLVLGRDEWSTSCSGHLSPRKECQYSLEGWVGPRASLDIL